MIQALKGVNVFKAFIQLCKAIREDIVATV